MTSYRDEDQGVVLPAKLAKLHGGHGRVHLEAVHHVLVVVDEYVAGGEGHGDEGEAAARDLHLLQAEDGVRQRLLPDLLALQKRRGETDVGQTGKPSENIPHWPGSRA